jgi:hypothetical protein
MTGFGQFFSKVADLTGETLSKVATAEVDDYIQKKEDKRDLSYINSLLSSVAGAKPNDLGGAVRANQGSEEEQYAQGGFFDSPTFRTNKTLFIVGGVLIVAIFGFIFLRK